LCKLSFFKIKRSGEFNTFLIKKEDLLNLSSNSKKNNFFASGSRNTTEIKQINSKNQTKFNDFTENNLVNGFDIDNKVYNN
jgi:hypothetical protein